ncbi:MAG: hypothetical protein IJS68_03785 [Clostridia bacterium]|nr:hypothetical protein [Clostridia bacterium]
MGFIKDMFARTAQASANHSNEEPTIALYKIYWEMRKTNNGSFVLTPYLDKSRNGVYRSISLTTKDKFFAGDELYSSAESLQKSDPQNPLKLPVMELHAIEAKVSGHNNISTFSAQEAVALLLANGQDILGIEGKLRKAENDQQRQMFLTHALGKKEIKASEISKLNDYVSEAMNVHLEREELKRKAKVVGDVLFRPRTKKIDFHAEKHGNEKAEPEPQPGA